jgi:hypothetical protein
VAAAKGHCENSEVAELPPLEAGTRRLMKRQPIGFVNGAILNGNYELQVSIKSGYNSKPRLQSLIDSEIIF